MKSEFYHYSICCDQNPSLKVFNLSHYSRIFIWQTCNALFILRIIFTHLIKFEKEDDLIKMLSPSEDESLLEGFAVQLVEILIDIPLK